MQWANSTLFQLRVFFRVSPFKEQFKNQTLESSKQQEIYINQFLPKFTSNTFYQSLHIWKINWLPVTDRV